MGKARDQPRPNWITDVHHHDWDRSGRLFRRPGCWSGGRNNHVHVEPDELHSKIGEALGLAFRVPALYDEILAFYIAPLSEPFLESFPKGKRGGGGRGHGEIANPVDLPHSLRFGGERRSERTTQRGQQEAAAVHHSMI